jgi:hypothetical protein
VDVVRQSSRAAGVSELPLHLRNAEVSDTVITYSCLILAASLPVLTGWAMWLRFNYLIAKRFGVVGLEATPAVALAFRPRDWIVLALRRPFRAEYDQRLIADLTANYLGNDASTTAGDLPW